MKNSALRIIEIPRALELDLAATGRKSEAKVNKKYIGVFNPK
jgi:hypothetical protein